MTAASTRPAAPWRTPLALAAVLAALVAAVIGADRPPAPAAPDADAARFSEARARPLVHELAEVIGPRPAGSVAHAAAAERIAAALRAIPGVEVDVQDATGAAPSPFVAGEVIEYRVRNVVARLPGREPGALLLAAHFDSAPDSAGAADNAAGVAVLVEVARALATATDRRHGVVLLFNGGEEVGLVGASAFAAHPWARDATAFVNLDAAGAGGRAVVFRGGSGDGLTELYAAVAPRPHAWSVGRDLMASGLLPSDTDYGRLAAGGVPGLDVALYHDGWAYHTGLDRLARLEPGAMQHTGDNVLAVARAFAAGGAPEPLGSPAVFHDVLGVAMISYGQPAALALLAITAMLVLIALALARRSLGRVAGAAAILGGAVVAAVLAAAALGVALALIAPHGWFGAPALAVIAAGAIAAAIVLAGHRWVARRAEDRIAGQRAAWAVALVAGLVLLALTTLAGASVSYVALWWTLPGALALAASLRWPRATDALAIAAAVPGVVVTGELVRNLVVLLVPMAGRMGLGIPLDPVIAIVIGLPVALASVPVAIALQRSRGTGALALLALGVALAASAALVVRDPYDAEHPRRIHVQHRDGAGGAELSVEADDGLPADAIARSMGAGRTEAVAIAPAAVTVTAAGAGDGDVRRVVLRVTAPGATALALKVPRAALAGWSVPALIPATGGEHVHLRVIAPAADGWSVELAIRGAAPVPVELVERHDTTVTPALAAALRALPPWCQASPSVRRARALDL